MGMREEQTASGNQQELNALWEGVQRFYQQKGYVILASRWPFKLGTICEYVFEGRLPQPFRIIEETTREEFDEQQKVLGTKTYGVLQFFYRAVTE
jgi:hypothetical protein